MNSTNHQTRLLDSAEKMLNRIISLDEATQISLTTLAGKIIEVDALDTGFVLFIMPSADGVKLAFNYTDKPDVAIKAKPSALLGMLTAEKFGAGDVEINGNVGLAQKFQSILRSMEIDWEEYLSQYVGDITAHQMGNIARRMQSFVRATAKTIGLDVSEYLRYEKEVVVDESELDVFIDAVDQLRNDVERLQQRIQRLDKQN